MSVYVLAENGAVKKYPYTLTDMRRDNPSVSFTPDISDAIASEFNVFRVEETAAPIYNAEREKLVWDTPIFENGAWKQQWRVDPLSSEELDAQAAQWRQSASCTPFQGRMALIEAGLMASAQSAIDNADEKTKTAWEYALTWQRQSPMITALGAALGLTNAQIDDLFRAAQEINA